MAAPASPSRDSPSGGGFSLFTPAVADLDCDGRLEVAGMTREGYLHVFRTNGLASAARHARHWHPDATPGTGGPTRDRERAGAAGPGGGGARRAHNRGRPAG